MFNKIKTVKKTVEDFGENLKSVNLTAKSTLSGAVLPNILEGVAFSDAFVFNGDRCLIKVDGDGNLTYNGEVVSRFDGASLTSESVLYEGKRYLHLSDGERAVMICLENGQSFSVETVGIASVFYKGRLFLSDGYKIMASAPLNPTVFGGGVTISFLPYEDLGKIIAMTEYCNKIYAFFEKGAIAFTEKDGAVCEVERLLTFGVDILPRSVKKVDKSIYFCATDGVYRVMGKKFYKLSAIPIESVATASFGGSYWIKTTLLGQEKVFAFSDGDKMSEFSVDTVGVVGESVILLKPITEVLGEWQAKLSTGVGYKCLKTIKLYAKKPCVLTVSTANASKNFTVNSGENSLLINLYANEFLVTIKTVANEQLICRFEYEYYE